MNTPTPQALKLQEKLKEFFPEDGYYFMGLNEITRTWERGTPLDKVGSRKPLNVVATGERSAETLSSGQIGFFGNLHNCIKPENLNDFNMTPTLLVDERDQNVRKLLLGSQKTNKLGQVVVKIVCVIWREYTPEEKAEYAAKKAAAEAAELGYGTTQEDMMKSLMTGF